MDQVQQYREVLDLLGEPHPAFELAFRWLADRRPPPAGEAIVHGDFRLGNVIVDGDGLAAVLDWELAHVGDPMEDLGWLCVKAWRFGGRGPVAGLGEYRDLFDAYSGASGRPVDPEVVRWWEVLGTLKWGIMCIMQASAHLTGASRSHELAAIGRRVCENEHDLLALMGVSDGSTARCAHRRPARGGRPGVAGARRGAGGRRSAPVPRPGGRQHAGHRGARAGARPRPGRGPRRAPGPLGVADDAELARRIRSGELDDRLDEVKAVVAASVRDKLTVANPRYLDAP